MGQGNIFRSVCQEFCSQGGGIPVCLAGGIPACLAGLQGVGIPACLASFQAHTQGEVEGSGRGVSRPTPSGVSWPTPGGFSRPTSCGGVYQHALRQTPSPTATAAGGTQATGMHSCWKYFQMCEGSQVFCLSIWRTDLWNYSRQHNSSTDICVQWQLGNLCTSR